MGFYIKDVYVDLSSARRQSWRTLFHDPLTNPPGVPETSPAIAVAALSPVLRQAAALVGDADPRRVEEVAMGIGVAALSAFLPADDGDVPPSRISPVALFADGLLDESDLRTARDVLRDALGQVDRAVAALAPSGEELELLRETLQVDRSAAYAVPAQA